MPHSTWKGYIRLSLVSIPVRAYSAVDSESEQISFNQLHKTCHSRIKYVKTCPIHGPVQQSDIVSGYEYERGQYVVIDKSELEELESSEEKMVTVESIVPLDVIDPLYFTERSSYLVPDGLPGQKPYAVIQRALSEQKSALICRSVRHGKDSVVMIQARDSALTMTTLNSGVRDRSMIAGELPTAAVTDAELKLTKTLFEAFSRSTLDVEQIRGHYFERVRELIDAKLAGQQTIHVQVSETPPVINLMDALRKSIETSKSAPERRARKGEKPAASPRPRRKSG